MRSEIQQDHAARFHELLDGALDRIGHLLESGVIDEACASQLRQRERTLRYQVRQLRSASASAHSDLLSGLEISWGEFARSLSQKSYERQRTSPKESRQPESG